MKIQINTQVIGRHRAAKKAVKICKIKLETLGFTVSDPRDATSNGHDLIGIKNGRGFTFEVKKCFYSARSWRVSKIMKASSDVVAIVFPSGDVHFESMKNHIATSAKDKSRSLNSIGLIYE